MWMGGTTALVIGSTHPIAWAASEAGAKFFSDIGAPSAYGKLTSIAPL